ncbi:hypothetical protein GCK72_004330 [Caenorhabditis remanei]|uniref:Thioredoxin-like fold domain-containing protein n=1 Tax=Caenorhabditis remanei TaxID=31234 RepID=A0A6A5HDD5_CAERE|nr:hypothetical protein GCK72_004330 [Caenorhabditis remanei]KAF1764383.1 hypothetical protein GCK72_004330 [Caenorhabditis remanei]
MSELFKGHSLNLEEDYDVDGGAFLKDKMVALVFTSINPRSKRCTSFNTLLKDLYKAIKSKHDDFELVFIVNNLLTVHERHFPFKFPWVLAPFGEKEYQSFAKNYLVKNNNIPCLFIIKPNGDPVLRMKQEDVLQKIDKPDALWQKWADAYNDLKPKPINYQNYSQKPSWVRPFKEVRGPRRNECNYKYYTLYEYKF